MLRWLALGAVLALAVPASADAACGVDPRNAAYETPEVQVYDTSSTLRACRRATGVARTIGPTFFGVIPESTEVNEVLGGRWVWSSHIVGSDSDDEEDPGSREDMLLDLRTNQRVEVQLYGVNAPNVDELIALPGAFVTTGGGVTARFPGGRTQQLSTDAAATGLAARGARVYWNVNGVAQSAVLTLPAAERPRARPRAVKIRRCAPRPGARLIVRDDRLVVTSVGRQVYACRNSAQRLIGNVQDVQVVSDRHVLYARAGMVGVLETGLGTRTELPGAEGAAGGALLLAAGPGGMRTPTAELSAEPASEPALAEGRAYWLDGAGMPRTQALAP